MKILVTGGTGFLGRAVIVQLVQRGHIVRTFARTPFISEPGIDVENLCGDLRHQADVDTAVRGVDAVIHTGAKVGYSGKFGEFYAVNVLGTQNVVKSCVKHGVSKLVYTSSPSVVFAGKNIEGGNESLPYAKAKYLERLSPYAATKALAEQFVRQANSAQLATVTLRPHLIWGPGDPHIVAQIIHRARRGSLTLVGSGHQLVDAVYITNAAYAHVLAVEKIALRQASQAAPSIAGEVFFITNQEPWPLRKMIQGILSAAGLNPRIRILNPHVAFGMGAVAEFTSHYLTPRMLGFQPEITRFVALQLSKAHWFDPKRAQQQLGYSPLISVDQGLHQLSSHLIQKLPR